MTTPLTTAQERVAMSDPDHLKRWLSETGRDYIVFKSIDLIDSLSWPHGVATFMSVIDAYRAHRREAVISWTACPRCTPRLTTAITTCKLCGGSLQVIERTKTDALELDEIDEAIAHLQRLKADRLGV